MSSDTTTSTPQAPLAAPSPTASSRLIATLGLIALFSGLLVVSVVELTRPYIVENQRLALEAAVLQVIPGATQRYDFVLGSDGVAVLEGPMPAGARRIYAGYDAEGQFKGVALEAAARGYADIIRVLYGYDPQCQCIIGIKVLESKETPGLGDKIETDARFLANFEALDARLDLARERLANAIVTVRPNTKEHPWQIDGISGATISANAIGRMLNDSAATVLPQLVGQWPRFAVVPPVHEPVPAEIVPGPPGMVNMPAAESDTLPPEPAHEVD